MKNNIRYCSLCGKMLFNKKEHCKFCDDCVLQQHYEKMMGKYYSKKNIPDSMKKRKMLIYSKYKFQLIFKDRTDDETVRNIIGFYDNEINKATENIKQSNGVH